MIYIVYTDYVRDTQIYSGEVPEEDDEFDPSSDENECHWNDYSGEMILDVVNADSESEAIRSVAEELQLSESIMAAYLFKE